MERKIDEIFEFEGVKLKVKQATHFSTRCNDCFFSFYDCDMVEEYTGVCCNTAREDDKEVELLGG